MGFLTIMGNELLLLLRICIKEDYFYLLGCYNPSNPYVGGCASDLHTHLKALLFGRANQNGRYLRHFYCFLLIGLSSHT